MMPEPFFRFFLLSQAMAAVSIILFISFLLKINLQYFNNRLQIFLNALEEGMDLEKMVMTALTNQRGNVQAFSFCYALTYLMLIRD